MHGLQELVRESMLTSHRLVDYDNDVEANLLAQHQAIFDAIVARDPLRAREAAGTHLDYVSKLYRDRLPLPKPETTRRPAKTVKKPESGDHTMTISSAHWGDLADGTPVDLHTLSHDNGLRVSVTNLGAALVSWFAPDRDGHLADILLGHDAPAAYTTGTAYMGAIVGRWANRIADARFSLDGVEYPLEANQPPNSLHGGFQGFSYKLWQARHTERRVGPHAGIARGR